MNWQLEKLEIGNGGDPSNGVIVAGPWDGEFGWEMMRWHAGVRKVFKENPDKYKIAISSIGRHPFYEKADVFYGIPDDYFERVGRDGVFKQAHFVMTRKTVEGDPMKPYKEHLNKLVQAIIPKTPSVTRVSPKTARQDQCFEQLTANTTKYSDEMDKPYIVIAPRKRQFNAHKNWPVENWKTLIAALNKKYGLAAIAIGTPEEVKPFNDVVASKEEDIVSCVDLLSNAEFAVCPESGMGYLSLLCGCMTVVFGKGVWRRRYTFGENPLGSPIRYLSSGERRYPVQRVLSCVVDVVESGWNPEITWNHVDKKPQEARCE